MIAGASRHVIGRKIPRSGGHRLVRRQARAPAPRCRRRRDGSPSAADRAAADRRAARGCRRPATPRATLASDICPASSTNSTSTLRANSGRDHSHAVPPSTSTVGSERRQRVLVVRRYSRTPAASSIGLVDLRGQAHGLPPPRRLRGTSSSRLRITLWLVRRDAHPLPARTSARSSARRRTSCPRPAAPGSAERVRSRSVDDARPRSRSAASPAPRLELGARADAAAGGRGAPGRTRSRVARRAAASRKPHHRLLQAVRSGSRRTRTRRWDARPP